MGSIPTPGTVESQQLTVIRSPPRSGPNLPTVPVLSHFRRLSLAQSTRRCASRLPRLATDLATVESSDAHWGGAARASCGHDLERSRIRTLPFQVRLAVLQSKNLTPLPAVQCRMICAMILCSVVVSGCAVTSRHGDPGAGQAPSPGQSMDAEFRASGPCVGPSIEFDAKGVDFNPWVRRFISQIRRSWHVPNRSMGNKGHVVVTFSVMTDGTIAEVAVPIPSKVEDFNRASYDAVAKTLRTFPLPPEYPADRAFFTVTFYYNEEPPAR